MAVPGEKSEILCGFFVPGEDPPPSAAQKVASLSEPGMRGLRPCVRRPALHAQAVHGRHGDEIGRVRILHPVCPGAAGNHVHRPGPARRIRTIHQNAGSPAAPAPTGSPGLPAPGVSVTRGAGSTLPPSHGVAGGSAAWR